MDLIGALEFIAEHVNLAHMAAQEDQCLLDEQAIEGHHGPENVSSMINVRLCVLLN